MDSASILIDRHEQLMQAAPTPEQLEQALSESVAYLESVERHYAWERTVIESALHPQVWKDWKVAQLDKWRQERRNPLVQSMTKLHQHLVSVRLLRQSSKGAIRSIAADARYRDMSHVSIN